MRTLVFLSLSLAVALSMPPFPPGVAQNLDLVKEDESPLLGDLVPVQGHVEVEDPAPQPRQDMDESQSQSQSVVKQEVKAEPEVKVEQEVKAEPEVKVEPEVQVEQELKAEPEVKVEPEVQVEQELKAEPEVKPEPQVQVEPEPEVNLNPDVMAEPEANLIAELEMEPEFKVDPDFKVESEVKVVPDVQMELEPEENQDEERHIDMERQYETVDEPMELEPLDDNNLFGEEGSNAELSEVEKSLIAAFNSQDPVAETLPDEEGHIRRTDYASDEEPIMQLQPEMGEEPFQNQEVIPDGAIMEEGPALDIMGQQISTSDLFPNEEAKIGMEQNSRTAERSDYSMMNGPLSELVLERDGPSFDGAQTGVVPEREENAFMREGGQSYSSSVTIEGKRYQFFEGPKTAEDAEFFCQSQFPGGHLASITSSQIHREVMNMIPPQNRRLARTWIGGIRYLKTGRFIWLDGSHWGYADWLSGEPNNTEDVENCLELLVFANGKFNDFTCWEPLTFICSHPV